MAELVKAASDPERIQSGSNDLPVSLDLFVMDGVFDGGLAFLQFRLRFRLRGQRIVYYAIPKFAAHVRAQFRVRLQFFIQWNGIGNFRVDLLPDCAINL